MLFQIQISVHDLMGNIFFYHQLWNLSRLCVEFSSTYGGTESLPVTGFTFQEPENDPRNFCYLWTMQGHLTNKLDHVVN